MRRFQRGEVMVLMMVAMLALMPMLSGQMGLFGHGGREHGKPASAANQGADQAHQHEQR